MGRNMLLLSHIERTGMHLKMVVKKHSIAQMWVDLKVIIRKNRDFIIICVSFLIIITAVLFGRPPGIPFITQSVDNVERLTIVAFPNFSDRERTIYIDERTEIEHIYRLLNRTMWFRVHRRPEHPGMVHCPRFTIRLEYGDGEIDEFSPTEADERIFRFIDTRSRDGAQGFIIGRNPRLQAYIDNLIFTITYYTIDNPETYGDSHDSYLMDDCQEALDGFCGDSQDYQYVISSSPHFRVLQVSFLPNPIYYRYEIFNSQGDLVKSRTVWRVFPWVSYVNNSTLKILTGPGTNVWQVIFYSITEDMFSDIFQSPLLVIDEEAIISHIVKSKDDTFIVVVQDFFDPEIYYKEFQLPLETLLSSSTYMKYLGKGRIEVRHLFDESFELTNVIIQL